MSATLDAILPLLGLDTKGAGPLYHRLRLSLEQAIMSGKLHHGDALYPERALADYAKVSRVTVRKAIDHLVREGWLVRRPGSGTFVAQLGCQTDQRLAHTTSLTEEMFWRDSNVRTEWVERSISYPSPEEMMALGLSAEVQVARLHRLRICDDLPLAIERTCISAEILPDPLRVTSSIYAAFEDAHVRPVRAIQRILACAIHNPDASVLKVKRGAPGLLAKRIAFLPSGRPIEFTRSLFRGDAGGFINEFKISET